MEESLISYYIPKERMYFFSIKLAYLPSAGFTMEKSDESDVLKMLIIRLLDIERFDRKKMLLEEIKNSL